MSAPSHSTIRVYSVRRAQTHLAQLIRDLKNCKVVEITSRGRVVASVVRPETLETLEIMANPEAMKLFRAAKSGKMKCSPMPSLEDEDFWPGPPGKAIKRPGDPRSEYVQRKHGWTVKPPTAQRQKRPSRGRKPKR